MESDEEQPTYPARLRAMQLSAIVHVNLFPTNLSPHYQSTTHNLSYVVKIST